MSETRAYQPIQVHHCPIEGYESEWVEFYDRLPTGRALQLEEMKRGDMSESALALAMVAALLKAWSLVDYTGAPLPATHASYLELDMDMVKAIATTMKAHAGFLAPESLQQLTQSAT